VVGIQLERPQNMIFPAGISISGQKNHICGARVGFQPRQRARESGQSPIIAGTLFESFIDFVGKRDVTWNYAHSWQKKVTVSVRSAETLHDDLAIAANPHSAELGYTAPDLALMSKNCHQAINGYNKRDSRCRSKRGWSPVTDAHQC